MAVSTGLQKLDAFLSGGIPRGVITDVFGGNGTGKTQLLLQLAASSVRSGDRVLYIDTTGKFRPERIVEIQRQSGAAPNLEKITASRITNTSEQIRSTQTMLDFSLVIIDSITDLFTYEYAGRESVLERNSLFMKYMRTISNIATSKGIPVVVANTVRTINETEIESMKSAIDPFTHIKIHLSHIGNKFHGRVYWALAEEDFAYELGASGLCKPQDI
ncbi:MAG: recombinase RecA [Nitrosopumilus sp. B06]|nr:MAG: recombinase RecA [Nitrosopumilus sp. D6]RNJ80300.1 MAG: recombinase RecA [Nitrosopumilus sp. B06]